MNFAGPPLINFGHSASTFYANTFFQGGPNDAFTGGPLALGQIATDKYGRRYRWAYIGAVNTVAGSLYAAPTMNGSQIALAVANTTGTVNAVSMVAGGMSVIVTPGAAIAANQYLGGTLIVSFSTGLGGSYRLSSHLAGNSTINIQFNLDPAETGGFTVAGATTTVVDLVANPYNSVVVAPTTPISQVVGVATGIINASSYGWLATHGEFPCLCDSGAPAIYTPCSSSAITAGAVGTQTGNATVSLLPMVGYMVEAGVSAKAKLVFLTVD